MRHNPRIRHIYEADNVESADYLRKFTHNVPRSVINELANNKYDVVIDPSLFDIPVHRMLLLRQIKPRVVLGFNKWPSINHYTRSLILTEKTGTSAKTFSIIADYLQLDKKYLHSYDLHIPQDVNQQVREYLAALNGRNVVINILPGIRTVVCRRRSWHRLSPGCVRIIPTSTSSCSITAMKSAFPCGKGLREPV